MEESHIFIPIALWYGVGAKVVYYRHYESYKANGKISFGGCGDGTMDLKFDDFKWKLDYLEGTY